MNQLTPRSQTMVASVAESRIDAAWRRPAPKARRLAKALYAWGDPAWSFTFALVAAAPFLLAAAFAPALLSLSPTVSLIGPIAEARAVLAGAASLREADTPLYLLLLMAGDIFADAPGRVHLVAKAIATALIAYPTAYFASARMPATMTLLLTAALAAYVASPFSGPAEISLALFVSAALALAFAPADEGRERALVEGVLCGGLLAMLWIGAPAFAAGALTALAVSPFLTGRARLRRYAAALAGLCACVVISEILEPGLTLARAAALASVLDPAALIAVAGAGVIGAAAVAAGVVIFAAAVFGGSEHVKGWGVGAAIAVIGFGAARIAGADPTPIFALAAAAAAFSVASPFYDGVFRDHDRASISISIVAAMLTLFWTASIPVQAVGQFFLQNRVAGEAPENIRTELALVQPGGPSVAKWIEEGRFTTPEARELFALAPVDQSEMLLEAASRARKIASYGVEVAILTGADAACVLAGRRACRQNGAEAAVGAKVVFVPRLDLDPATALAKGRSEALLYTEFKLVEQTPLWDIWVRRGSSLPAEYSAAFKPATGR